MPNMKIVKPIQPITYSLMAEKDTDFVEPGYLYFSDLNEVPYIPGGNLPTEKIIKEKVGEVLSGISTHT